MSRYSAESVCATCKGAIDNQLSYLSQEDREYFCVQYFYLNNLYLKDPEAYHTQSSQILQTINQQNCPFNRSSSQPNEPNPQTTP